MPEFFEIGCLGIFGILGLEWRVASLAAALFVKIFYFSRLWQGEKRFGGSNGVINHIMRDGVIFDNGKAGFTKRPAERVGKSVRVGLPAFKGDRRKIILHEVLLDRPA